MDLQKLSSLFAAELSKNEETPLMGSLSNHKSKKNVLKKDSSQTILQLNAIPLKIDIESYKNAHSINNPTGDYKAAYLFTVLANSIPNLSPYYNPSPYVVTDIWDNLINAANANTLYTQHLLDRAREKFTKSALAGMGGIPEHWYPVYANPSNWYDMIEEESALIKMELNLQSDSTHTGHFIVLDKETPLMWKAINRNKKSSQLNISSNKTLKKISLHVLRVDFIRPWFDFEILDQQNWKIKGLNKGYYSNGSLTLNEGIFPLLTQSILLGTKISLEGDFSTQEINELSNHKKNHSEISLGPFLLNTPNERVNITQNQGRTVFTSNIKQVIGYLSRLTPMSPALSADSP